MVNNVDKSPLVVFFVFGFCLCFLHYACFAANKQNMLNHRSRTTDDTSNNLLKNFHCRQEMGLKPIQWSAQSVH